jgi:hypothetical protein
MSLIECKECKNKISKKAKQCPSCGVKISKFSLAAKVLIGFLVVCYLIGKFESSSTTSSVATPVVQEKIIEVSAANIAKEYEKNEARADAIYKGNLVRISGTVAAIDKDFSDDTVVNLVGLNMFTNIHATMEKSEESKAINLQKGAKVILQCRGNGEVVGSPMLKQCIILTYS